MFRMFAATIMAYMVTAPTSISAQEIVFTECRNTGLTGSTDPYVELVVQMDKSRVRSTTKVNIDGNEGFGPPSYFDIDSFSDNVVVAIRRGEGSVTSLMIDIPTGRFWRAGLGKICLDNECEASELRNWKNDGTCKSG